MNPAALQVTGLSYSYAGKPALDNVSFELPRGRFLALLGANGAGKTTLFSLLTRLLRLQHGEVSILGTRLRDGRAKALGETGVVFQQSTLDPDLTVQQNLLYHAALHGIGRRRARSRIDEELVRQQLTDCALRRVRELNGGHRRRVEIVRALLHAPKLLLLDEATSGLDVESREQINLHVRELCRSRHIAALWCTHLVDELSVDDELLLLHEGKARLHGSARQLLNERDCASVRELLRQCNGSTSNSASGELA